MAGVVRSFLMRYGTAVAVVLAAVLVRIVLNPLLEDHAPLATFYAAIMIAAWYGGFGPAMAAIGCSLVLALWLSISPFNQVWPVNRAEIVALLLFVIVGLIIAALTETLRKARRDVTARNSKLIEAELRIRAVVDHVVDGIITINDRAMIETFNPAAEKLFGYKASEVIGRNVSMLMPEPYHGQHDKYVHNYLTTGVAKIIGIGREVVGLRKDGTVFPMDLAVSEFRLGSRHTFVGIVRDISERKRSEEAIKFLTDASGPLAALVDYESTLSKVAQLSVPFLADWCTVDLLDAQGALHRKATAHADPAKIKAVEALELYPPANREARHGPALVASTDRSELIPIVSPEILAELQPDEEKQQQLRALGLRSAMSVPLEIHGRILGVMSLVSAESGHQYGPSDLAIAEDLARRAAIAIENARLYAEAKDADRRKDEFLAMLAHELRNPLAPIRSGLDLLEMEGIDGDTAVWARNMMKHQVEHLVRLVDDLLDVSRIMRGKVQLRKESIQIADAVSRGIETTRPLIESQGHELIVSVPTEPIWIDADPVRLAQVIANLLNNAAKYSDKRGHIWITAERQADEAIIEVRDDGVGIEKDLLPKVFDLFTQADRSAGRSQGGLGIGLTLVRNLVEMHGGTVEARSEGPGRGSQFTVRLPVMTPAPRGTGHQESGKLSMGDGHGPRHRVLVVDDNAAAARLLSEIVTRWNHEVRVAYDGETALEVAKNYHPNIVLLDIGLPGMNGYQVAMQLRDQPEFERAMLVAVTGYGQEEDRRRSREAGFNHHLVKPVAPEMLHKLLAGSADAN